MPLTQEHEIHRRRFGRNLGVGLLLACFIALIFGLTVVKVKYIDPEIAASEVTK